MTVRTAVPEGNGPPVVSGAETVGILRGGEMGAVVQSYDWASTSLGPIEHWSEGLLAVMNLALNSTTPTAVYWGPEMLMIYNDGYRDNLGDRHPAALGASAREVFRDLWPRYGDLLESVLSEGVAATEEKVKLTHVVGGHAYETYWNFSVSPIYEDGKIAGIYKTDQNITDEVNATNALIESDERLRLALSSNSCLGTWDWHVKRDMVFVEERFARLFGIDPRDSRKGLPRGDFLRNLHVDDRQMAMDAVDHAVRTGEEYKLEYRIYQPDGSLRWVVSRGVCIYDEQGEPTRFPGITFDITALKESEAAAPGESVSVELTLMASDAAGPVAATITQSVRRPTSVPLLVESIVTRLVDRKDAVVVRTSGDTGSTVILVEVAAEDLAKIVGEKQQMIKAIRRLLAAASSKANHKYSLELVADGSPGARKM